MSVWRRCGKNAPQVHTRMPKERYKEYQFAILYLKTKWGCRTIGQTIYKAVMGMADQEQKKARS